MSFTPPVKIDVDAAGKLVVTSLTTTPPPPPPPPTFDPFDSTAWEAGKNIGGTPGTTGSVSIDNTGTLHVNLNVPDGNDSAFGYASAQRGSFPWGSSSGMSLPPNLVKIRTSTAGLSQSFLPGHSRLHVYVALYYKCPAAFNGWFDAQVRLEWIDGAQMSSTSPSETYGGPSDPSVQADGYATIVSNTDFSIDVEGLFQAAAQAWNVDPASAHSLAGLEIGLEGFLTTASVNWLGATLTQGTLPPPPPPPPTLTYTLEAPVPTVVIANTTLAVCEADAANLLPNTPWQIIDSNGTVVESGTTPPAPPPTGAIDQVVIVILENTGLPTTLANAPFLVSLAKQYGLSTNWSHLGHPSEPNYVGISFGDTLGCTSDGDRSPRPAPTILDFVQKSGRSWKVIQNGSRGADHNGFLLETPKPTGGIMTSGDTPDVISAVIAGTSFVWFTPSDNQNAHDNGIQNADQWLSTWIPGLLTAMSAKKSLLIITFDESFDDSIVYTAFAGPAAKKGYTSNNPYTHYSFGRLIEALWGGTGLRNSDNAPSPTEFLA